MAPGGRSGAIAASVASCTDGAKSVEYEHPRPGRRALDQVEERERAVDVQDVVGVPELGTERLRDARFAAGERDVGGHEVRLDRRFRSYGGVLPDADSLHARLRVDVVDGILIE